MNVKELVFRGEDAPQLYSCGRCGAIHSPRVYAAHTPEERRHQAARTAAEECCAPRHCACGVEIEKYWTACRACRERHKLQRATIISAESYDGPVYADDLHGEWGEGYSSDIEGLREACKDYDEPMPAYVHPCDPQELRIDADRVIEGALDGMHEGADDQLEAADELFAFIDDWNKKQTCVSYSYDRSRVIVLDRERFDALIAADVDHNERPQ